jgi:hypothetical protein
MKKKLLIKAFGGALLLSLMLSSCFGASSSILFNRDGSGTITMDLRLLSELDALGRLDGNASMPPLPIGREDFERTVSRVPGLDLQSWSESEEKDGAEKRIQAKLAFDRPQTLITFLGGGAAYTEREGERRLSIALGSGAVDETNPLSATLQTAFAGYQLEWSFNLPEDGSLKVLGADGAAFMPPQAWNVVSGGKRLRFAAPVADILAAAQPGLSLELVW